MKEQTPLALHAADEGDQSPLLSRHSPHGSFRASEATRARQAPPVSLRKSFINFASFQQNAH